MEIVQRYAKVIIFAIKINLTETKILLIWIHFQRSSPLIMIIV